MTTQFQVGQEYAITGYNDTIKVVKRTDKSVWFEYAGETLRKKIHNVSSGEKVVLDGGSACVFPESVIETSVNEAETIETNVNDTTIEAETINVNASAKFSDTHTIIVESLEPIKDVEYAEICHAFDLNDGACFLSFGDVYVYSKPVTFNNDGIYYVPYETLNGRSGGSYKVKVSANVEPKTIEKSADEIISLDELDLIHLIQDLTLIELENANRKKLETLEFPQDEILETLDFPQGSTQDLDKFEVTYQVAESEYEVSYESRKVYAYNHEHAKSIVIQSLQAQNLRHIITGCEYALMIDDLSDFAMAGYDEF